MAKRKYYPKPALERKIARERIEKLFSQAEKKKTDQSLANRYVTLARKISMKYKVRIPPVLKRKFCKHCYQYFVIGKNSRVRTAEGKVVYSCFKCKKFMRFPYKK